MHNIGLLIVFVIVPAWFAIVLLRGVVNERQDRPELNHDDAKKAGRLNESSETSDVSSDLYSITIVESRKSIPRSSYGSGYIRGRDRSTRSQYWASGGPIRRGAG